MNCLAEAKLRGHDIYSVDGEEWRYSDTGELTAGNRRSCARCGIEDPENDNDPCIANLPNVMNACCGHGDDKEAYVQFLDGNCIRGIDAVILQGILKM